MDVTDSHVGNFLFPLPQRLATTCDTSTLLEGIVQELHCCVIIWDPLCFTFFKNL